MSDTNHNEICRLDAVILADHIRAKRLSPVEVIDAVLDRMDKLEPILHAFCTPTPELARCTLLTLPNPAIFPPCKHSPTLSFCVRANVCSSVCSVARLVGVCGSRACRSLENVYTWEQGQKQ